MPIQRMAIVDKDGLVVNVISYDTEGTWTPPADCILVDAAKGGSIDDTWDGKRFVVPIEGAPHQWWQK